MAAAVIGVLSDSHGNLELLRTAAWLLRDRHGAEQLIHLGDYYRDALVLRQEGWRVWPVPGTRCPAYGTSERILRENIGGISVVAAHTPEDLAQALQGEQLALHGHTHIPFVERRGAAVWLNPGHLKSRLDRGQRPSYAVLSLEPGLVQATLLGLDGELHAQESFRMEMETA